MRDFILSLGTHLGKGFRPALRVKQRVIAKTALSVLLGSYIATHDTLEEILLAIHNKRNRRTELCSTIPYTLHTLQQQAFISLIVVTISGITSRAHTWLTTQCIDLQACIIGKTIQTRT